ncbi:MAG: type II toxin-antitoxin system PemK/MazF family toxin [Gemmatimonadota bacterium]
MESLAAGAVVLIPFPFSDLSQSKLRPAVVLADVLRGDFVLCQVTSNPYGDPIAVTLIDQWFSEGSLQRVSYARPGKLFTANANLVVAKVGTLKPEIVAMIVNHIKALLDLGRIR